MTFFIAHKRCSVIACFVILTKCSAVRWIRHETHEKVHWSARHYIHNNTADWLTDRLTNWTVCWLTRQWPENPRWGTTIKAVVRRHKMMINWRWIPPLQSVLQLFTVPVRVEGWWQKELMRKDGVSWTWQMNLCNLMSEPHLVEDTQFLCRRDFSSSADVFPPFYHANLSLLCWKVSYKRILMHSLTTRGEEGWAMPPSHTRMSIRRLPAGSGSKGAGSLREVPPEKGSKTLSNG